MKHPCPVCKRVWDDGRPYPPGADPARYLKSHKYCPQCIREVEIEWENSKEKTVDIKKVF